jgi:hypothetical protein
MSNATRKRAARGRIQPYAWLGVGAVTLGMGAALVGGTAVAFADTGNDTGATSSTSAKVGSDSAASTSPKTDGPRRPARSGRANAGASTASAVDSSPASSAPGRRGRAPAADISDTIPAVTGEVSVPDVTPAVGNNKPLPAAALATHRAGRGTAAEGQPPFEGPTDLVVPEKEEAP